MSGARSTSAASGAVNGSFSVFTGPYAGCVNANAHAQRLSVEEAVDVLSQAAQNKLICLGAEGFWLSNNQVTPSLDHILDLSSVTGQSPRTNASLAIAVIEAWPGDPAAFAVELVMMSDAHPCPCCGHLTFDEPLARTASALSASGKTMLSNFAGRLGRVARTSRT